jgi:hypothetical protein
MRFLTVVAVAFGQIILAALLTAFLLDDPSPPAVATLAQVLLTAPYRLLAVLPLVDYPPGSGIAVLFMFLFDGVVWAGLVAAGEWLYRNR